MTHLRMARATSVRKPVAAPPVRRRALAFAVAAIFEGAAFPVLALPSGPQVVAGTANISQVGNQLTINNSAGAILDWQKFGIGANELVRFNQPSASSAVLNRVVGVDPSVLLGQLSSNGRVWLVNPTGILVGQGARIDTAAFVASTLNIANADFLAQRLNFAATPGAGSVVNQGRITTPLGGSVYLVGANVANEGVISTPKGDTILAAGQRVELIDTATPGVKVQITGAAGNATNLGSIVAEAGRIGIAGALVKNSGTLNASSVEAVGGRIFLRATKKIEMAETSKLVADGAKGGNVTVIVEEGGQIAGELVARGALSAQGGGGFVETSAGQADIGGLKVDVNGGFWLIDPYDYTIDAAAATTIKGTLDGGGSVAIDTTNNTGPGAGASGNGDITVSSAIAKSAGGNATLTLNAHNNINLNADITSTVGQLNMVFNPDLDSAGGGAVVLGTTTLNANGGTISAAGKTVNHSVGTASINSAMTAGNLNLSGGTLAGTGSFTLGAGGAATQTEATLSINTFNLPATATYNIGNTTGPGATTPFFAPTTFNNSGTVNWSGTGQQRTPGGVTTFNNLAGGQFNIQNAVEWDTCCSGGSIVFNNLAGATITKSSVGTTTFNDAITLVNGGTLNINAGTLTMNGTGGTTNNGTINIATGATATFSTGWTSTGNVGQAGTLNLTGAWSNVGGTISQTAGTTNLGGTFTIAGIGTISRSGGNVNVAGTLTNTGNTLDIGSAGAFGTGGLTSLSGTIVGGTLINSDAATPVPMVC